MQIGELSKRSGISRRALRYYEEQGLLVPERGCNGYREYADDAAQIVSQIQGLYFSGLNSDAIRRYLPCARGQAPQLETCSELRSHLLDRAADLDNDAQTAARQRDTLLTHLA